MTLAMPDSVNVADLPGGYPAYLGYADGAFANAAQLRAAFPAARLVLLTVTGGTLECDGADVEKGDLEPDSAALWAKHKLAAYPQSRPVLYASIGSMMDVIIALGAEGVAPASVRLLSAHWGDGPHICGPDSCRLIGADMDGTQWTSQFKGLNASDIDMSMLQEDFFGTMTGETEKMVNELGTVRQGDTGEAVKTVQALCNARLNDTLAIDGVFGGQTLSAVKFLQSSNKLKVDGVVGLKTWPVLLGVA